MLAQHSLAEAERYMFTARFSLRISVARNENRVGRGYFVDPSYFIASGKIVGARGLKRAKKYVKSDGSFTDARFDSQSNK
jgi:hypothetical protein